jgi:hypothetical protein
VCSSNKKKRIKKLKEIFLKKKLKPPKLGCCFFFNIYCLGNQNLKDYIDALNDKIKSLEDRLESLENK